MKLRNLNAAIDAAPKVYIALTCGVVALEKTSLKAALKARFGAETPSPETGMKMVSWTPARGAPLDMLTFEVVPPVYMVTFDEPPPKR